MSFSGDSRAEYCPERIDLLPQLRQASGVLQDQVGRPQAIFAARLGGNSGRSFCSAEPIACHHSLDLRFMINIDRDDNVEVLVLTGFDQKWDDMDHDRGGIRGSLELGGPRPHCRVHDAFQVAACERISKDNVGQPCPVELAVFTYLRTETINDCGKPRGARLDDLASQQVSVNDDSTARCQFRGYEALARGDTAGQADP
jgi:hypothetical protein